MTSNISRAIELAGGQIAMAQALSAVLGRPITQQSISLWNTQGYAPRKRHDVIVTVLDGRITHAELAEDITRVERAAV